MTMGQIDNKVKVSVFISSKCDDRDDIENGRMKYGVMRKALKLLLEETGVCNVYGFEEAPGATYDVVHSYMEPLADADLVIVIVDNKDGITDGTMKEIHRVKALSKKCLYVFCDEREKQITELQAELETSTAPRFKIAHEFSDIAEVAYEAVIADVLTLYKSYCNGRVDFIDRISNPEIEEDDTNIPLASDVEVSKAFITGFNYTKYIAKEEANVAFGEVVADDSGDMECAKLLGTVIGSNLTQAPDFEKLKRYIKSLHNGDFQILVLMRYEAVEKYFNGEIEDCVHELKKCLEFCDSCTNIPKWLANDVALDLRNIQIEVDREKNIINFKPQGQERLDRDEEPLYYPVLDRIISDFNGSIMTHQFNRTTQSPYTINIGGADYAVEKACNSFIVAFYYGSITQMVMLRKRLYDYLTNVSMETKDHKTFMFSVKLLLMSNDEKVLKRFLYAYGENTNNINNQDVDYLVLGIRKQPIKSRKLLARIHLLKHFGYYFSDENYKDEVVDLLTGIKMCIKSEYATAILIKPMIEALIENERRIGGHQIADFILFLFENECKRYYDDAFNFIYRYAFEGTDEDDQKKYQTLIINCLSNEEIRSGCYHLVLAAQTLRQHENISHDSLDRAVRTYTPKFYENTYVLNTQKHKADENWEYTKKFLADINKDNDTQGKNGYYTSKAYDPYLTIVNIIVKDGIRYNSRQMEQILFSVQGTLMAETQTMDAKGSALLLLCALQLSHPKNRQIKKFVPTLKENWGNIVNAEGLFLTKGYGREHLEFTYFLLRQLTIKTNDITATKVFVQLQNSDVSIQITALRTMQKLLNIDPSVLKDNYADSFVQFVMNESYSTNFDVRFEAMTVIVKLLKTGYRKLCLERLVEMIDNEPYKNKVGLLYRLQKDDKTDPKVKYIFEKARTDCHYWVRKVSAMEEECPATIML